MSRSTMRWRWLLSCAALFATAAQAAPLQTLEASTREPRAFGYFVGDVVSREIVVRSPKALRFDAASLPQVGRRGGALELRHADWQRHAEADADRYELRLDYQVFLAPREARVLEMPPVMLRFEGAPRAEELRIDAWPIALAPLVPIEASPRHGLGELRPDIAPPPIDTGPLQRRLAAYALVGLLALGYLGAVYLAWPWWQRWQRPFARAWQTLRGLKAEASPQQLRGAVQRLHEALNDSAGQVLFEQGIERFVARQPRFAPLRDDIAAFFRRSREAFFAEGRLTPADAAWLVDFCRRCRNLERGAA
jgi:mxaA protein